MSRVIQEWKHTGNSSAFFAARLDFEEHRSSRCFGYRVTDQDVTDQLFPLTLEQKIEARISFLDLAGTRSGDELICRSDIFGRDSSSDETIEHASATEHGKGDGLLCIAQIRLAAEQHLSQAEFLWILRFNDDRFKTDLEPDFCGLQLFGADFKFFKSGQREFFSVDRELVGECFQSCLVRLLLTGFQQQSDGGLSFCKVPNEFLSLRGLSDCGD